MKTTKNTTFNQRIYSLSSLKSEIKSIFRYAKEERTNFKDILNSVKIRVYESQKYITLPNYMRSEIKGYVEANFDIMYDHVEFGHWYNGKFVGKSLPFGKGFKQELIDNSAHVYIGTEKIYS